jgi:glycolate oxidase
VQTPSSNDPADLSPANLERAKRELERALGLSKVITDASLLEPYARDESEATPVVPHVAVLAEDAGDIAKVLRVAADTDVPVTPRAGGTGRSGGAIPARGGIVLATHKLARIKHIDRENLIAVVEPGVVTGDLHAAVEAEGLFYPPDPNSWKSCCIGGNVAENAGGPRAFKYGSTRDYVLGLEVCLIGGTVLRTGKRTAKGVTGYDVTSLLVGSEGTLGVFSEITLRLVPKPREVATALALFRDARAALGVVTDILGAGIVPRCIEFLDAPALVALRREGVALDAGAEALLLIELDSRAPGDELEQLGEVLTRCTALMDIQVAQDAARRDALWAARRAMSPATRKLAKHKIAEDVVVPRDQMPALLDRVARIGQEEQVAHLTYGHAGDGNLHVNFLWNDASEAPQVERAVARLMRDTVALGGTLSGEHGVGLTKQPFLALEQSPALIALQERIKASFDPKNLLNPGKIFPVARHPVGDTLPPSAAGYVGHGAC